MDEARGTATADKARGVNLVLYNAEWALPEGFASRFDGQSGYFEINSSATVCTADMDYTLGFWFKAAAPQVNAIMLSNGDGVNNTSENPKNLFAVGWNASGELCYRNNGYETVVPGNWADDTWHNFAFTVSRSSGHARTIADIHYRRYGWWHFQRPHLCRRLRLARYTFQHTCGCRSFLQRFDRRNPIVETVSHTGANGTTRR